MFPKEISTHLKTDCSSQCLFCPKKCGINVYRIYNDITYLEKTRGHICSRDLNTVINSLKKENEKLKVEMNDVIETLKKEN